MVSGYSHDKPKALWKPYVRYVKDDAHTQVFTPEPSGHEVLTADTFRSTVPCIISELQHSLMQTLTNFSLHLIFLDKVFFEQGAQQSSRLADSGPQSSVFPWPWDYGHGLPHVALLTWALTSSGPQASMASSSPTAHPQPQFFFFNKN